MKSIILLQDVAGRQLATLVSDEPLSAGYHEVVWWGRDDAGRELAAGIYMARLVMGELVETCRLTLVK